MSNSETTDVRLGEAATRFIATLPVEKQQKYQQEIKTFILWYGRTGPVSKLTVTEIDDYTDWVALSTVEPQKRLEPVRAFLNYARKEGFIKINLAAHVKAKKGVGKGGTVTGKPAAAEVLTAEGRVEMETELVNLKSEAVKASEEIRIAAADKDFRENAPMEAAREKHGRIMSRLREVEAVLWSSSVANQKATEKVRIGTQSKVTVLDMGTNEKVTYSLVSPSEVKSLEGKISIASPLGKALLDHLVGDVVSVAAPVGTIQYRIEGIENR